MSRSLRDTLPYRPCAGAMVLNREGKVWIGKRRKTNELTGEETLWQMPQGGIDEGEDGGKAALRELYEETSIKSVELVRTSTRWFTYDLPDHLLGISWKGRYRGQKQIWALLRFTGDEGEINVVQPAEGRHKAEFSDWMWCEIEEMLPHIVPFKRDMYREIFSYFAADIEALKMETRRS